MKPKAKPKVYNNGKIEVYKLNSEDEFQFVYSCFADVNKHGSGGEFLSAGATQDKVSYVFTIRYSKQRAEIENNTQSYRIKYRQRFYNVVDYDDFNCEHKEIKLLGVGI